MIRVSVMYPAGERKKFDHRIGGAGLRRLVPNFTDMTPQMQISEIIRS